MADEVAHAVSLFARLTLPHIDAAGAGAPDRSGCEGTRNAAGNKSAGCQRPGTIALFGGTSNYNPYTGVGSSSFQYWEEDTFVTETMRRYKGAELSVIERIRVDGQRLIYKHEVTGPDDKRDEREIVFDLQV